MYTDWKRHRNVKPLIKLSETNPTIWMSTFDVSLLQASQSSWSNASSMDTTKHDSKITINGDKDI